MSQLYIQYRYKSMHATFWYPSMWHFTLSVDFGLWRLFGANPEDVCGLSRPVTRALPLRSLCQAEKPPRIPPTPPFFLRHSTYITTKSSFKLTWSCSSAHFSSPQARHVCLHVTLLSKPLKEDTDFSNCRKRLKRRKVSNSWTEKGTSNTLPVSLFRPMCSHNKHSYFGDCILSKHTRNF